MALTIAKLTENLKPFLKLTKAMKTLPMSCDSLIKTVALKFLMKTEKRKTSIERQGCKWGWRRVVFFEQFVCFLAGFAQKSCPGANPCAAVLHNVIIGQRWFS